jgi:hypothetical protein
MEEILSPKTIPLLSRHQSARTNTHIAELRQLITDGLDKLSAIDSSCIGVPNRHGELNRIAVRTISDAARPTLSPFALKSARYFAAIEINRRPCRQTPVRFFLVQASRPTHVQAVRLTPGGEMPAIGSRHSADVTRSSAGATQSIGCYSSPSRGRLHDV